MKVLSILLAISVGFNLWFGSAYLGQRDTATVAKVEQRQAVGMALNCSEGTEKLETAAAQRKTAAAPKIAAAQQQAQQHNREADRIMATPPAVPGDACASAQAELDSWWAERAKP
jgi:LAS superfamily LD-carboxypeptidase LdcB